MVELVFDLSGPIDAHQFGYVANLATLMFPANTRLTEPIQTPNGYHIDISLSVWDSAGRCFIPTPNGSFTYDGSTITLSCEITNEALVPFVRSRVVEYLQKKGFTVTERLRESAHTGPSATDLTVLHRRDGAERPATPNQPTRRTR